MLAGIENLLRGALGWEPNPSTVNQRGVKLFEAGQVQEALAEFDRAIAAAPYFAWAWFNRAGCRAHLGEHQSAIEDCTRAIELNPTWMPAWNSRGLSHLALGQHAQAHADFERAVALDATDVTLYYNRAIAAFGLGRPDQALADLNVVICRDPNHTAAIFQRAIVLATLGKPELSRDDYRRVTELDPGHADAWRELGTNHYFAGQLAEAINALSHCLSIRPDEVLAANNRAVSRFLLGQYADAEAELRGLIARRNDFPSAKKNLAWLLATCPDSRPRSGREAVELATQALEMVRWDQPAWLEVLAAAHAEQGDFEAAAAWQIKAMQSIVSDADSSAARRLRLYESRQPFRHLIVPGQPFELIPGGRAIPTAQKNISRD
jgi:tetratricopeptide (TPR) repeat protein